MAEEQPLLEAPPEGQVLQQGGEGMPREPEQGQEPEDSQQGGEGKGQVEDILLGGDSHRGEAFGCHRVEEGSMEGGGMRQVDSHKGKGGGSHRGKEEGSTLEGGGSNLEGEGEEKKGGMSKQGGQGNKEGQQGRGRGSLLGLRQGGQQGQEGRLLLLRGGQQQL